MNKFNLTRSFKDLEDFFEPLGYGLSIGGSNATTPFMHDIEPVVLIIDSNIKDTYLTLPTLQILSTELNVKEGTTFYKTYLIKDGGCFSLVKKMGKNTFMLGTFIFKQNLEEDYVEDFKKVLKQFCK